MSLAHKALIVDMSISQWAGRKFDKHATGTVENTYSTQGKVGQYTKKLLPGAKELDEVTRVAGSIRKFFYDETLPWATDGARILKSQNYMPFVREFAKRKGEFDGAVDRFLQEYPNLRDQARAKLGDLFRETEYPTVEKLRDAFKCEAQFFPMPDVGDFRVEILDSEKEIFLNRMREVESRAMRECWTRLYDVVSNAAHRLQDPNGKFKNSLIENISEICTLLPKLNVTDDPTLETMRQAVEKLISGISPDDCRKDMHARADAAKALDDITAKMGAIMGGI